jgi:hypothetical protein
MARPRILITSIFLQPGDTVDRRLRDAGFETTHRPLTGNRSEDELIALLQGVDSATAAENLIRALRGERPEGLVNPEVLTQ